MSNIEMRRKALGAATGLVLLFIATSPLTTILLIRWQAARIVNDSLLGISESGLASLSSLEGFREMEAAVNTPNDAERGKLEEQIAARRQNSDLLWTRYEAGINDDVDRQNYARLIEDRTELREVRGRVFDLLNQGHVDEAAQLFNGQGLQQFHNYADSLDRVMRYNIAQARSRGNRIMWLSNIVIGLQVVLLVFFVVYAFFVPWVTLVDWVTRRETVADL